MRSDTRIQLIAGMLLVASIAASGVLTAGVAAESGRAQLGYADTAEQSDPPEVGIGIAMGAFRGLFVNILWIRAQTLKEEGKFHEAVELARTITRLQPRFPRVWGFHAWNMAYNISVATQTAEERWQWVDAGIKLLRDEGIPKNPNDMQLHKELAWIFVHKIQGVNDDANRYYKRELAREWTFVLGPPPPRGATRDESTKRCADALQEIIDAPDTLDELYAAHPKARDLVQRFRDDAKLSLDLNLLRHNEMQRALVLTARGGLQLQLKDAERNPAFEKIILSLAEDPDAIKAYQALITHIRKRVLIDTYHMEPQRMKRYTEQYGPLDWRHPATHGLYWATRGVEEGLTRINTSDFDQTNTDRLVTHALQELFRWGQIYYDPLSNSYVQMLDLDFTDTYGKVLNEEIAQRGTRFDTDPTKIFTLMSLGYENFLRDVIRVYYRAGRTEEAEKYFHELRNGKWKNLNNDTLSITEYGNTLAEFVELDMQERITSPEFAASEVYSTLTDAYTRGLLRGDMKVFTADMEYAASVHKHYMEKQNIRTTAGEENRMEFMRPVFVDVAADALLGVLGRGDLASPWQMSRMYRILVASKLEAVPQAAYDLMVQSIKPSMPDFDTWFPEPPGMAEYRAMREAMRSQSDNARKDEIRLEKK